jgi:pimeloyl-ACP methyl ester carboxylesterase
MAERMKPVLTETIDSGHLPMLSKPEKLAGILTGFVEGITS